MTQDGVTFDGVTVELANQSDYGIYVNSGVTGSGTYNNVSIFGPATVLGLQDLSPTTYTITGTNPIGWTIP